MYHHFYHLKHDPFADAPDPEFLFLSPRHKTALQTILNGIEKRRGFLGVFGAAGLGKTTLLHAFLAGIHEQQRLKTIQVFYPKIAYQDMFEMLFRGLDLERTTDDPAALFPQLHQALLAHYSEGWNVALVVDDVQDMSEQTLTSLLCLSDLKTPSGVHLLQTVLMGLPVARHLLKRSPCRPLTSQATLTPLTPKESLAYIRHRLAKVLVPEESLFAPGALKPIIRAARGNPRVLNTLCANVLITGVMREQKPISPALVQEVITEFHGKLTPPYVWWGGTLAAGVLFGAGLWLGLQLLGQQRIGTDPPKLAAVTPVVTEHPPPPAVPSLTSPDSPGVEGEAATEVPRPESTMLKENLPPVQRRLPSRKNVARETAPRDAPAALKQPDRARKPEKTFPAKPPPSRQRAQITEVEKPLDPLPRSFFEPTARLLRISSRPVGALVMINRKVIGTTPVSVRLPRGVHTVIVAKQGYRRASYDVNLNNRLQSDLHSDLQLEDSNH